MTYEEFVERLSWYFSRRDIEELNRMGFENAKDSLTYELTVPELYEMGRDFILNLIRDIPGDNPDAFRENLKETVGIEMTEPNAAALLADLESGAF